MSGRRAPYVPLVHLSCVGVASQVGLDYGSSTPKECNASFIEGSLDQVGPLVVPREPITWARKKKGKFPYSCPVNSYRTSLVEIYFCLYSFLYVVVFIELSGLQDGQLLLFPAPMAHLRLLLLDCTHSTSSSLMVSGDCSSPNFSVTFPGNRIWHLIASVRFS